MKISERTMGMVRAFVESAVGNAGERRELLSRLAEERVEREGAVGRADKWLTTREAAELFGVNRATLRNWEKRGRIRGRRWSKSKVRWSRNELEAFAAGGAV